MVNDAAQKKESHTQRQPSKCRSSGAYQKTNVLPLSIAQNFYSIDKIQSNRRSVTLRSVKVAISAT
jgi:hypothetical protein